MVVVLRRLVCADLYHRAPLVRCGQSQLEQMESSRAWDVVDGVVRCRDGCKRLSRPTARTRFDADRNQRLVPAADFATAGDRGDGVECRPAPSCRSSARYAASGDRPVGRAWALGDGFVQQLP